MACLMVSAREPTDVPMALATSLAPTPQAMKKPNAQASTRSTKPYSETKDIKIYLLNQKGCWRSTRQQLFQTIADALGAVSHVTDPFDDLVEEHDVYRRQFLFQPVQFTTNRDLHAIGFALDFLELLDHAFDMCCFAPAEAGFEQ